MLLNPGKYSAVLLIHNVGSLKKKYLSNLKKTYPKHKIKFVDSGKTRQESSKKGLYSIKKYCKNKKLNKIETNP